MVRLLNKSLKKDVLKLRFFRSAKQCFLIRFEFQAHLSRFEFRSPRIFSHEKFHVRTLIYRLRESSELNIPKSLLCRAVKSNCLGLSCPDASAGNSGWCFELPRMWGFHLYHFCLLHSAPWPSNMI